MKGLDSRTERLFRPTAKFQIVQKRSVRGEKCGVDYCVTLSPAIPNSCMLPEEPTLVFF